MLKKLKVSGIFFLFCAGKVLGQVPVADFTADVTTGCTNLLVHFNDLSTNNPTSWSWDFGNGTASTLKNPSAFYAAPGTYTVKLIATNASGSDPEIKTSYIRVFNAPIALFSASPLTVCAGSTVNFTDQSTPGESAITSWVWDFGDGHTLGSSNASNTYISSGFYSISLSVTDANGCLVKKVQPNYIVVTANPVAAFTGSPLQFCTIPKTVNFISSSTGAGLIYAWNFGDGGSSIVSNPTHNYTAFGTYSVSLNLTDQNGCTNKTTPTAVINVADFQANFSAASTIGCDSVIASFTDLSVPSASNWKWDFGDGNSIQGGATTVITNTILTSGTYPSPIHRYLNDGLYTVKLIATNSMGCIDTIIKTNYIVVNSLPTVSFVANKTDTCGIPYTVNFTDNTVGAASWQWTFGDGNTSTDKNHVNTYLSYGDYDVSLVVIDVNGCTNSLLKYPDVLSIVTYIHINPPQASIHRSCECDPLCLGPHLPFEGCLNPNVKANPISFCSSPGSGGIINSWQWTFDNGNTSNLQTPPTQTYTATGAYTATLTIGTSNGCSSTTVAEIARAGIPPVATFTSNVTVGCYPLKVQFMDLSISTDPGTSVNDWMWLFGDGDTLLHVSNPSHTYQDTGQFTVSLTAFYNGCPNTYTVSNYIHVLPPKTSFTVTPGIICSTPRTVSLINGSQGAQTWHWDFGDGVTSTQQNPSPHTYIDPGFYTVKLVTTNTVYGCADSLIKVNAVKIANTIPGFTAVQTGTCAPATGTFADTSKFDPASPILTWQWIFGDGHSIAGPNTAIPAGWDDGFTTGSFKTPVHTYTVAGTFSVTLKVVDLVGCIKTITKQVISIRPDPTAQFSADVTSGCRPLTVAFTNSSFAAPGGIITQYTWDFGDGSVVSSEVNPTHLYSTKGSYSVTLSLTDILGCSKTLIKPNYINPTFPYTNFAFNTSVCNNASAQFINLTSPTSGLTYFWDFGDGSTSNAMHPLHAFVVDTTKLFNVKLKAKDSNACDSTISHTITVVKPQADFGASATIADCPPFVVQFNDSSSLDALFWLWNFGDGASSTLKNPLHTFNNGGKYTITLIVTTAGGCRDTLKIPNMIIVGGPSGSFSFSPSTGCAPLTVDFVATATKTEMYQWVFGDGATATGNPVSHTYTQAGTFNPLLLITDSLDGPGDTLRCTVQVPGPNPIFVPGPHVDFSSSSQMECTPTTILFTNSTNPLNGTETFLWNFGDGTTSTAKDTSHFYSLPGTYSVTLTVTLDSCVYTVIKPGFISIFDRPQLTIAPNGVLGCTPYSVKFTVDTSTVNYSIAAWNWDFGDGVLGNGPDPVHIYTSGGTYSVSLTIVFTNSCSAAYPLNQLITVFNSPIADFNLEAVIAGNYISSFRFYNLSQGAINYSWNFGDGSISGEKDPEHSYNTDDLYGIKLIAYSIDGCTDTIVKEEKIYFEIKMPNIFTPGGDGINDYFNLLIPGIFKDFNLNVYDKWGAEVFKSDNYQNDWDGRNKYGRPVDDGTYYYVLKYKEKYAWYGWVMIINNK